MMALALLYRERFVIFFCCDLSNYNQLPPPPPTRGNPALERCLTKNYLPFLSLQSFVLYLSTRDQWFWCPDVWHKIKGNENIRTDYKKPFYKILSGCLHFRQLFRIRIHNIGGTPCHSCGSGYAFILVSWIRIQKGQTDPQKWRKFKFWSARCSLLGNEDLFCSLDVLYGGLKRSKLEFLIKNIIFFNIKFFPIFGHQNPGSRSGSALTKNAGSGSKLKPMRIHITELVHILS
jgi:hypothetical protein